MIACNGLLVSPRPSRHPSELALHGRPCGRLKLSAIRYESQGHVTVENDTWGQILASLIKQERSSILKSDSPPMLELNHLLDTDNLVGFVAKYALGSPNANIVLRNLSDVMVLTATIREADLEIPLSPGEEGILMHLLSLSAAELSTIDISEPLVQEEAQEERPHRTFLLGWALMTDLKSQRTVSSVSLLAPYYNTVKCSTIEILNVPFAVRGSNYGELLVDLLFALHLSREKLMVGEGGRSMAMSRPFLPAFPLDSSLGYWARSSQNGFNNLVASTMQEEDSDGILGDIELSDAQLKERLKVVCRLLEWPDSLFETVYAKSAEFIKDLRTSRLQNI